MTTERELKQQMTQYLLGELSDTEQAALEQQYFADPQVFSQLAEFEADLVDDYARGQLTATQRLHFEQHYLANPHLRPRAEFAQSLQVSFQPPRQAAQAAPLVETLPARWSVFTWFNRPAFALALAALAFGLAILSFSWWRIVQRLRHELTTTQTAQQQSDTQRRKLEVELADERARYAQLQNDLAQAQPKTTNASPVFVTLLLTATGIRSSNATATPRLTIPANTEQVRVQLTVPVADEYRSYRAALQTADSNQLWQHQNLKPRRQQQTAVFNFPLSASLFNDGDYVLILTGVTAQGEADEISQSLFHVTKR